MKTEEIWKNVPNYEGLYQVSSHGNLKNKRKEILKLHKSRDGYYRYTFSHNYIKKKWSISRLVATVFIENPENKPNVNHKDNNPLNNEISNLEWCTQKENIQHSYKYGKFKENLDKYGFHKKNRTQKHEAECIQKVKQKDNSFKYRLKIGYGGSRQKSYGSYYTLQEAIEARDEIKAILKTS
jgi:hypothetical protein